jgi:hypothetical protein
MTRFLFSKSGFLSGLGRVIDIGATMLEYNSSLTPTMADYLALKSDWDTVGEDMNYAIAKFAEEHE